MIDDLGVCGSSAGTKAGLFAEAEDGDDGGLVFGIVAADDDKLDEINLFWPSALIPLKLGFKRALLTSASFATSLWRFDAVSDPSLCSNAAIESDTLSRRAVATDDEAAICGD